MLIFDCVSDTTIRPLPLCRTRFGRTFPEIDSNAGRLCFLDKAIGVEGVLGIGDDSSTDVQQVAGSSRRLLTESKRTRLPNCNGSWIACLECYRKGAETDIPLDGNML
jgi:hypothetical protein